MRISVLFICNVNRLWLGPVLGACFVASMAGNVLLKLSIAAWDLLSLIVLGAFTATASQQ